MKCEDLVAYLSDYIDHNLDENLTAEAEAHLATCHNCRVVLNTTQQTILLYQKQGVQAIPPVKREKLYEKLREAFLNQPTESRGSL